MANVLSFVVLVLAADPVPVKFPPLAKGDRYEVEFQRTHELGISAVVNGNANTTSDKMAPTWEYTQTIDELGMDGNPTKFRREFGKAEALLQKQTKPLAFQNSVITFEKSNKLWKATLKDGVAVTGIEQRLVVADLGELPTVPLTLFTPEEPVVVGKTWQPDKKVALAVFSCDEYMTFDATKAKVSAKLAKIYEKGGKRCGEIEFSCDAPISTLKGAILFPGEEGSILKVEAKLDGCIDGSERQFVRTSKMTIKFSSAAELRGQPVQMSTAAEISQREVIRPARSTERK